MANKTYPRVGSKQKVKDGQCKICGNQNADLRVTVQFTIFRGDDEVYKVHKSCIDKLGDEWLSKVLTDYVNMPADPAASTGLTGRLLLRYLTERDKQND